MKKKVLIKNAKAIVTVDKQDRVLKNENILIEGNQIKYIGKEEKEADEIIDAKNCYVYPGLVNTHHHFYQTFSRNLPQVQKMELFPWLTTLYEIWRGLDEKIIYNSSLTAMGELLKYGCTTSMDHLYVFPKEGSDFFIDEQFRAASDLGMRFTASRGSMSRGKKEGGLPPDDLVQKVDIILKDSERLVKTYHDSSEFSMRQMVLAPCSPFSVTTELLKDTAILARELNVRLHTHLAETKDEEDFCLESVGMRPLEYMESVGWIGEDVWFAHGIHFNNEELKRLQETKTGVAHCPVSNMKLSSGVCRVPEMLEMDIPVGLATDGSASNDCSNLLAEIRASYLLHRLTSSNNAPTGYDILKISTKGSASLLGRKDIGTLEVGKAADLFLLDVEYLEFIGTEFDPKNLLGTVGYSRPAKYVFVNGEMVVKDGELLKVEEKKIKVDGEKLVNKYINI